MPARAERPAPPPSCRASIALAAVALAMALAAPSAEAARRRRRGRRRAHPHHVTAPRDVAPQPVQDDERPPPVDGASSGGAGASGATSTATTATAATRTEAGGGAEAEAGPPRPAAIDVQLGAGVLARHLHYSGDLYTLYRPYDLDAAFALAAALTWFPGAHFTDGAGSWLGLSGSLEYAPGLSSQDPQGRSYATTAYAYALGLRLRVPLGRSEVFVAGEYGAQAFSVQDAGGGNAGVPGVSYQFVRLGAGARVAFGERLALTVSAAALPVLGTGEIGSQGYFPRASAFGAEGSLGLAVALAGGVELRVSGYYRRFFLGIEPVPGDAFTQGGASDEFFGGALGFALRR